LVCATTILTEADRQAEGNDTLQSVLSPQETCALYDYHPFMFWKRVQFALCMAAICGCGALVALGQTQLTLVQEIKLPVRSRPGTFGGGFWAIGMSADEVFQFKIAPDQSLLIFYPNTSGKWPLIRLRKWWTAAPETDELDLPGWIEANTLKEFYFSSDLLVTPDGNYAVALGGVASVKDAGNIPFPPSEPIEHKPDLLITVIDLNHWKIAGALHTATVDPSAEFRGAHIVNGRWIALQGVDEEPETVKYEHLYDRVSRLISVPDLKAGPGCYTKDPEILVLALGAPPGGPGALSARNDAACTALLAAADVSSMRVLDWLIYLGRDPEPRRLQAHTQPSQLATMQDEGKLSGSPDLTWPAGEYYSGYWSTSDWDVYFKNPPFESTQRIWYQLRQPDQKPPYQLSEYTLEGQLLKTSEAGLESKPQCSTRRGCDCTVVDASEKQNAILALCRVQSVNFTGSFDWHKQWLTVFRVDDLSPVGDIELKATYVRSAIAVADGHTYVVTAEKGKVVRVYSVPDR